MNIGDMINTTELRAECPVGTVIHAEENGRTWRKEAVNRWVRTDDRARARTDAGPGVYPTAWLAPDITGNYRITELPSVAEVSPLPLDAVVNTDALREQCVIGTEVYSSRAGRRFRKTGEDLWEPIDCDGGPVNTTQERRQNADGWLRANADRNYRITRLPRSFAVEDRINTAAERAALPVGSVIVAHNQSGERRHWTKTGPDSWERGDGGGGGVRSNHREGGGWFSDADSGYYTIVSLPVAVVEEVVPSSPVESSVPEEIRDYASLLALPVDSRFGYVATATIDWQVCDGQRAMLVGDTTRSMAALSVFEGGANAGLIQRRDVAVAGAGSVGVGQVRHAETGLSIGDQIRDRAHFGLLPVGTMLSVKNYGRATVQYHLTKQEGGEWTPSVEPGDTGSPSRTAYFDHDLSTDGINSLYSLPVVPVVLPEGLTIGSPIMSLEQFQALPVGSVVTTGAGQWEKNRPDYWTRMGGMYSEQAESSMSCGGANTLVSVPDYMPPVAEPVAAEFVPTLGMEIETVEQYRALPVHSVVHGPQLAVFKQGENAWATVGRGELHVGTDDSMSRSARVLISLPDTSVEDVSSAYGSTAPVAEVDVIARAEHDRLLANSRITARANARVEFGEEVLAALRETWDGHSFNEGEIDEVLDGLGLEALSPMESITVSVTVSGTTIIDSSEIEALFEGDHSISVDQRRPEFTWSLDLDFDDIEVSSGDCGCDQVGEGSIGERMRDDGVQYDSFTFSSTCSNH